MTTLRSDIRHRRGDSFTSKTYAVLIDGQPVDLDVWTITAQMRRSHDDPSPVHVWAPDEIVVGTVTFDRDGTPVTTDTVRLETPGADTAAWPIVVADWDLQIARDGDVHTIVEGTFRVTRDVTR